MKRFYIGHFNADLAKHDAKKMLEAAIRSECQHKITDEEKAEREETLMKFHGNKDLHDRIGQYIWVPPSLHEYNVMKAHQGSLESNRRRLRW